MLQYVAIISSLIMATASLGGVSLVIVTGRATQKATIESTKAQVVSSAVEDIKALADGRLDEINLLQSQVNRLEQIVRDNDEKCKREVAELHREVDDLERRNSELRRRLDRCEERTK